jgi:two-component system, OmpR family, phosphate regulon sensor histidine kinase PhoR
MKGPLNLPEEKRQTQSSEPNSGAQDTAREPETSKDPSNWIAEVSHELRLPIANIRLLVETLLDGALEDQEVCRRMLKRAHQEVDRLQLLVKNLLSVEQVAELQDQHKCQWINLHDRAKYAVDSVATMATVKNVTVSLDIDQRFLIYANGEQLDQVLLNLVENAVKFTNNNGKVTVKGGAEQGKFSVTDTGIGIPAAEIPKIFQRFYRVDRAVSKGSTGLGLSIVKHIIDLHGGKINVTSEEGKGSTFELEFPLPGRTTEESSSR